MYYYHDSEKLIVSSERLIELAERWTPLTNGEILRIKLQPPYRVSRPTANATGTLAGDG